MNRIILSLFSAGILLTSCSSTRKTTIPESEIKLPGTYIQNVAIDGKGDEWSGVPQDFSPRSTFQLSIANNNDNLFVMLRVPGQTEQTKLMQGGMDIWVDGQERKDKRTGISYPVKGELGETERAVITPGKKPDLKQLHYQMAAQLISLNRFGFKNDYNGVQSIRQNTGFKAAISWDENDVMIYELTIPFNAFVQDIRKDKIELGFNIHGMDRPKNDHAANGPALSESGMPGMGGRGGGGRGRSNFGSRRANLKAETTAYNQREKLYIPENFWALYTVSHQ